MDQLKNCNTCRYRDRHAYKKPCHECLMKSIYRGHQWCTKWKPMTLWHKFLEKVWW